LDVSGAPLPPAHMTTAPEPSPAQTIDVSAKLAAATTLKEAYEAFLAAMEAAGFERSDNERARQLMLPGTRRASRRAAPYTVDEFLHVAEALRREVAPAQRAA